MMLHEMQIDYMGVPSTAYVYDKSNRWLLRASEAFVLSKYLTKEVVEEIEMERKLQKVVVLAH